MFNLSGPVFLVRLFLRDLNFLVLSVSLRRSVVWNIMFVSLLSFIRKVCQLHWLASVNWRVMYWCLQCWLHSVYAWTTHSGFTDICCCCCCRAHEVWKKFRCFRLPSVPREISVSIMLLLDPQKFWRSFWLVFKVWLWRKLFTSSL